jgi:hypothetical protein
MRLLAVLVILLALLPLCFRPVSTFMRSEPNPAAIPQAAPAARQEPVLARPGEANVFTAAESQDAQQPLDQMWIGVFCEPVPELARKQLKIPGGLAVMLIWDNSPAAKAGLQMHDVILKINGQVVKSCQSLGDAIEESDGDAIRLFVLRDGDALIIPVRPEPRPKCDGCESVVVKADDPDSPNKIQEFQLKIGTNPTTGQKEILYVADGFILTDDHGADSDLQNPEYRLLVKDLEKGSIRIGTGVNSAQSKFGRDEFVKIVARELAAAESELTQLNLQFRSLLEPNQKTNESALQVLGSEIYDVHKRIECLRILQSHIEELGRKKSSEQLDSGSNRDSGGGADHSQLNRGRELNLMWV